MALSSCLRRGYEDHTSPVSLLRGVKEPLWHSQPSEGGVPEGIGSAGLLGVESCSSTAH